MFPFSKTEEPCDCGTLQNAADDPNLPIEFDEKLNEFHLVYGNKGQFNLYHCFFCGGKAPDSKRYLLFATLSDEERHRLIKLTKSLKTLGETIATLGEPDRDDDAGAIVGFPETEDSPPKEQAYRVLVYENLSDVANVNVTVYPNERVGVWFVGKYIGDKNEA